MGLGQAAPGHVDNLVSDEELAMILNSDFQAMDLGGHVIEIDTTDFDKIDYAGLFRAIESAIRGTRSE